jgi:hypothetical protein
MVDAALSIKLRCASWQQLATIYKRDISRGIMFLKASSPPALGTKVRIDLTLPSATVIQLSGVVHEHVQDIARGNGVDLKLDPLPPSSVWLIESALAAETKVRAGTAPPIGPKPTPATGVPMVAIPPKQEKSGPTPSVAEGEDVASAESELITALNAEAESLRKLNPFLVLGVGYEASDTDVRAAFGELTKRYHPDRFARYDSIDLRNVAAEIFILIRDAYRKLSDEASRAQALQQLGKSGAPRAVPPKPPPPRITQPMRRVPLPDNVRTEPGVIPSLPRPPALGTATTAAIPKLPDPPAERPTPIPPARPTPQTPAPRPTPPKLDHEPRKPPEITSPLPPTPDTGRPVLQAAPAPAVANAESGDTTPLDELLDAGKFDEALQGYKLLAKKHPQDRTFRAGIELCEGLRFLSNRDRLEAAQRFEAALEIDPSNERAARQLAEMRRQATNERKGQLSRLMGKKE